MKRSLIDKLCCPFDKKDLEISIFLQDTEENIIEGMLTCSLCSRYYPIVYGVPVMAPDDYRQPSLETPLLQRWQQQLKESPIGNFRISDVDLS